MRIQQMTIGTLLLATLLTAGCGNRFTNADSRYFNGPRRAGISAPASTVVAMPALAVGRPAGLIYDAQGQLLVADADAGVLLSVSRNGTAMSRATMLPDPQAVAVDRQGTVYIACRRDGSIVKVGSSEIRRVATGLAHPTGVAVAADGTLYVAQPSTKEVLAIAPDGSRRRFWQHGALVPERVLVTAKDELFVAVRDGQTGKLLQLDRTGKQVDAYEFEHPVTNLAAAADGRLLVVAGYTDDDDYLRGDIGWLDRDGTWTIYAEDVIDPLAVAVSPAGEPVFVRYDWDNDKFQIVAIAGEQIAPWLNAY